MRLPRLFPYFGSKWRTAAKYPAPKHNILIEPFAGSAGYATLYYQKQVKLYDIDPIICSIWEYLIKVTPHEIMSLPVNIMDVRIVEPQEAQWLVGYWMQSLSHSPVRTNSTYWLRGSKFRTSKGETKANTTAFWGAAARARIANAVKYIKHWTIEQKSFEQIENIEATWFIDPPYQTIVGSLYKNANSKIDFEYLGEWCQSRYGQVIVCDQSIAKWLPFKPLLVNIGTTTESGKKRRTVEGIWTNDK